MELQFTRVENGWTVSYNGVMLTKTPYSSLTKALDGKWRSLLSGAKSFTLQVSDIKKGG